ncbi:SDR family NAD(P)-dependent oxidoreductase [Streptomyces atriruber]|uniref:SDR family NAD(P)-dependent oxidoreductase n=1 Tax=Streptomyces atriruber TaxID=545121 RepID=A0ABV3BT63_9ACTN
MEIAGARIVIPGATGEIGAALTRRLHDAGASLVVAGRDEAALHRLRADCPDALTASFDAYDLASCAALTHWAARELGGLDAVVTCVGVAAFGAAESVSDAVAEHLMTVNALAPIAFLRSALPLIGAGGVLAAVTGVVARTPPATMADYAASKAALAAWLSAVGREQKRRRVSVIDVALPHVATGFADRAVSGRPPSLPTGLPVSRAVDLIVEAAFGTELPGTAAAPEGSSADRTH